MSSEQSEQPTSGELLYGCRLIGEYLGLSYDQAWHLIRRHELPHFRIGRRVCARRSALDVWLDEREAKAAPGHEADDTAKRKRPGRAGALIDSRKITRSRAG